MPFSLPVALVAAALALLPLCCRPVSEPSAGPASAPTVATALDGTVAPGPSCEASDGATQHEPLRLLWSPCPPRLGWDGLEPQCASTAVPLFWEHPSGLELHVQALRLSAAEPPRAQLWLVHGGPGSSGVRGFAQLMAQLHAADPGLELLTLDHRGVGLSHKLVCPVEEAAASPGARRILREEVESCARSLRERYGERLAAFSTEQAARDLVAHLRAGRRPGVPVFLLGTSYGSYLVQRVLQVAPSAVDGAVLDGVLPPGASFAGRALASERVGLRILKACAADSLCGVRLGAAPGERLRRLYARLAAGHCAALPGGPRRVRRWLARMLVYGPTNAAIPAVIHRLERCSPRDVAALSHLQAALFGARGGMAQLDPSYSRVLRNTIVFSELWPGDAPPAPESPPGDLLFDPGDESFDHWLAPRWPRYLVSPRPVSRLRPDVPLLLLQGQLDPATPWEAAADFASNLAGPDQRLVLFPHAAHNVLGGTPLRGQDEGSCGLELLLAFTRAPAGPLPTGCVALTQPLDFRGSPALAQFLFGTTDLWD